MGSSKNKKQKLSTSLEIATPSIIENLDVEKATKNQNDSAMFLAGKLISAVGRDSNLVFSPASINAALTMLVASSGEKAIRSFILSLLKSSSVDELIGVFRKIANDFLVDGSTSGGPKISAANGVWMEQTLPVSPLLKDLFENSFKAIFAQVDFRFQGKKVRKEVNSWVKKETNGVIKSLVPRHSIKEDTDCVCGNALYFKGTWSTKFPKALTTHKEFHLLDGTSVSVPFMSNYHNTKQYVQAFSGFKVLRLPFRRGCDTNRQFSMCLYLPNDKDGLNNLVELMASTPGFLDSHIPRYNSVGEFRVPKFKIEFGFEASKVFSELERVSLYHKAAVEIDEDGAEALAATAAGGFGGCCRRINFVADHPFLFLIKEDKTGTVLYVGQILDPSKCSSA